MEVSYINIVYKLSKKIMIHNKLDEVDPDNKRLSTD